MNPAVIITGNRGGLGTAMVGEFVAAGYRVLGIDLESTTESRTALTGPTVQINADLSRLADPGALGSLADELRTGLEGYDLRGLINNAATQHVAPLAELEADDLISSLTTNAVAPLLLAQTLLDTLADAGGTILNVSSIHVDQTKSRFAAYAVSKSALSALTRAMSIEWGDRVRVMELRPAAIATPMLEAGFASRAAARRQLDEYHPTGRIGSPAEIAASARQLIELEAPFLNGAVINADGGISHTLHDPDG